MALFDLQVARKPDHYPETAQFIEAIHDSTWSDREFNFRSDYGQFHQLPEREQRIIVRAVSAIAQIEVAVKTFWGKLGDTLKQPSIVDLGYVMANNEVIHNRAYERLLQVLELEEMFQANLEVPVIRDRVQYLRKYLERNYADDRKQFVYSICLFTLFVENVSLFSQFYTIMHFNRFKNVLKDTSQQVNYTMVEEAMHSNIGVWLINKLHEEYPELFDAELENRIVQECVAAYEAECRVIDWIIGNYEQDNLSAPILKVYVKNRLDTIIKQIGFQSTLELTEDEKTLLEKTEWMEEEEKGGRMKDFFIGRPVDYVKNDRSFDADDLF